MFFFLFHLILRSWNNGLYIKRTSIPSNDDDNDHDDDPDLTVLLVNQKNEYNTRVGRYHQVKPLIGLLTSTARTFIQDGVTTEFATQILGTTLDNGRIYAQLLTKSSLVLYNKPSNVDDPIIVQPTRIHSAFDGEWNVKQDLGYIDPEKFVLKNTDYLAPSSSKVSAVYASKPPQDSYQPWSQPQSQIENNQINEEPVGRRVQQYKEIPRYIQNEVDGPVIENEKKLEYFIEPSVIQNVNTLHRQSKAYEPIIKPIEESEVKDVPIEPSVVKVKPDHELPTFTIKNEFSPIFYYIDNVESRRLQPQSSQQTKVPKKLFGQKSEPRPKKTFTYEGFADFTTVVGDTVIIFTPNTETALPQTPEEVNVFPSARRVDKLATKITFLSADIPVATSTYKAHEETPASAITTPGSSVEENRSEKALFHDEESLKKVLYEVDDKVPDSISVQYNNGFDFNMDVIQSSEAPVSTTENTRLTGDLGVIPIQEYSPQATPFLKDHTLSPTNTILEIATESAVTEDMTELFTNSEEENENNAAEVTEKPEEEEVEEEEEEEEETTTEPETGVVTTTESGHSEESFEEIEATTEAKHYIQHDIENDFHEDVICTDGLETKSTMTTAYKTLTYLTTYFIPLESTETTTSIKSDVVVESNVGYITNVVCKTEFIEPTTVVNVDVNHSDNSKIQIPEITSEEPVISPPAVTESSTETASKTDSDQEILTTPQEEDKNEESDHTDVDGNYEEESEEVNEENEPNASTTTEAITTTQSHVESSVSSEKTITTTDKPISEEEKSEESENEIDVIYKTLYTTYTYFTTFFGDSTSSVASHKSVVTNVLTSTIDLSKFDPSLLGAFNEDEIAPTNVGIGRPTETYVNSIIDLVMKKDVIESVEAVESYSSQTPTPSLGDDVIASIKPDAVKTYLTTYTFFTTIYVGTDANVCSRSEVYTNYVGPEELIPTKSNPLVENTKAQFDFRNCKLVTRAQPADPEAEDSSSMVTSVSMEESRDPVGELIVKAKEESLEVPQPTPIEVDMLFSVESNPLESENLYVTDVKSSSSKGEIQYLDSNNILDDQISSESNIDEIIPSPTLLLQTSYTTFTYFTTMYIGKDSSKVKSHLETITNVVTETIVPNKEPEDESNLPITYYTTFTYWTTLYKDKSTTITSREEIVSNVVTPSVQSVPTINPIDTTPIDIDSVLPPKDLEVEIKPSLIDDSLEADDGKATFYTTYTYFTTFYAGNSSQIRSSLETVTNIVDNTKIVEDNQIARKVPSGSGDKNLIQDDGGKPFITPTVVKEEITPTKLPDISSASPTVLVGTYIDNLFAEVKPAVQSPEPEKKIIYSQVAIISGDSTIVTSDNKTLNNEDTTSASSKASEGSNINPTPEVIVGSEAESELTTERLDDDDGSNKKKSRLTFTAKKPSVTPVIIPFSSRNRPTFVPKRVPSASGAITISRQDATPTITATPTLKSASRPSSFNGNRKINSVSPGSSAGKRVFGRSSISNQLANVPSASRASNLARGSIQPTSRRTGFRSSSLRSNSADYISRSAVPRVRPTSSSRLQFGRSSIRPSASITFPPQDQNEYGETFGTQQDETATESLDEVSEAPSRTTNNPLFRFRRPPVARQPGTPFVPRSTTLSSRRPAVTPRGRLTTTTRKLTTRATTNPLLSLRRQKTNALFPRRNLFKQPEPEPEEEVIDEEEEILEGEEFEEDNDYDSSDRKERQVETPSTAAPKKSNVVQIRPFGFRRRSKRQVDYGSRTKFSNFRRPGMKTTRKPDPEPETEAPSTPKQTRAGRYNPRITAGSRTTTVKSVAQKASPRQSFIVRGESRTTTTPTPAYRRPKPGSRPSARTTTTASRPKAPRLNSPKTNSRPSTSRNSRTRTTTSRASSRQRSSFESHSGERFNNHNHILNDGKITITHQVPTEVTIPIFNGKFTEYKNVLSATPKIEILNLNQVSTLIGPLGNPQLVLIDESTELAENGATKIIKYILHETATSTAIFTPTTIRGRKTSFAHIVPSTVYNVEAVTQTQAPEINSNVPLANLLLSQLLLGNQQPAINPLLALQGQGLIPQQQVIQTPVTEYKTRMTTYVTTVIDNRESVLAITFKGRAIQTTIVDPTTNVITATEFITDTIVTSPTAFQAPAPQFNSLLLQQLLQQQQQQQQQSLLQTANPLLGLGSELRAQPDLNLNNLNQVQNNLNNDIYSNSPKPNILSDLTSNENYSEEVEEDAPPPPPTPSRSRARARAPRPAPAPAKLTSIVTLYVSGRHPGEFSTVLSTVISDDTQIVRKREAMYYEDVKVSPSILPLVDELFSSQVDSTRLISDTERSVDNSLENQVETQSLESIVGEISQHIKYDASPTYVLETASPSAIRYIKQSSVDDVS